jgi:anti-anti-sigma regulatory factor
MVTPQGVLRVHQKERSVLFQVEGQATCVLGTPLRRLAEEALGCGCSCIRIDLRHCTWMDSTFVGTLLLLCKAAANKQLGEFGLVSPSPECRRILRQMGVDRICVICDEAELPPEEWIEVERCTVKDDEFRCNVLQAHEQLAELPGTVGDTFRKVVQCVQDTKAGGKAS